MLHRQLLSKIYLFCLHVVIGKGEFLLCRTVDVFSFLSLWRKGWLIWFMSVAVEPSFPFESLTRARICWVNCWLPGGQLLYLPQSSARNHQGGTFWLFLMWFTAIKGGKATYHINEFKRKDKTSSAQSFWHSFKCFCLQIMYFCLLFICSQPYGGMVKGSIHPTEVAKISLAFFLNDYLGMLILGEVMENPLWLPTEAIYSHPASISSRVDILLPRFLTFVTYLSIISVRKRGRKGTIFINL